MQVGSSKFELFRREDLWNLVEWNPNNTISHI